MITMSHIYPGGGCRMVVAAPCVGRSPSGAEDTMAEHELLTPSEVAVMFRVNPKTVTRWARAGRISAIRTIGGHRRFRTSEIQRFLDEAQDFQA